MSLTKVDITKSGGGDSSKTTVNFNWINTNNTLVESSKEAHTAISSSRNEKSSMQEEVTSIVQQMRGTLEQLQISLQSSREDELMLLKSHAYSRRRIMLLSSTLERATACNHTLTDTLLSSPERYPQLETTSQRRESIAVEGDSSTQQVNRSVQTHDVVICDSRCSCNCHNICGNLWRGSDCVTRRDSSFADVEVEKSSLRRDGVNSNDERVEQLSHALLQTKKALRARERAIIDICVKFLHMRHRRLRQARREAELLRVVRCLRTVLACATQTLLQAKRTLDRERAEHASPPFTPSSEDTPSPPEASDSLLRSTPPTLSLERRQRCSPRHNLTPSKRTGRKNDSPSESSVSTSRVCSSSMDYALTKNHSTHFKLPRLRTYSSPYSSSSSTSSVFTRRFTFPRFKKFARPYIFSWRTRLSSLSAPYKRLFKSRSLYSWPSSSSRTFSSPPSSLRSTSFSSKQTSSLMSHTQSEHSDDDNSLFSSRIAFLSDSSDPQPVALDYFTCPGSTANFVSKSDPLIITENSVNKHRDHLKPLRTSSASLSPNRFISSRVCMNTGNSRSKQVDIDIQDN